MALSRGINELRSGSSVLPVLIGGRFTATSSHDPPKTQRGHGWSVVAASTGTYTITLDEPINSLVAFHADIMVAATVDSAASSRAVFTAGPGTDMRTFTLKTQEEGAAVLANFDFTTEDDAVVSFWILAEESIAPQVKGA